MSSPNLPGMPSRPQLTPGPLVLGSASSNDPDAVTALQSFLEESGGRSRWSTIHNATIRQRFGYQANGRTVDHLYMDDWSTPKSIYRRSVVGAHHQPADHDGRNGYVVKTQYGNRAIPEFDQAHLLAGNLPAAAASVILTSGNYIVKTANGKKCSGPAICIDVYLRRENVYVRQEEWVISSQSHLASTIDLILPSLFGGAPPIEQFSFSSYEPRQGVTVPVSGTVTAPWGRAIPFQLVRLDINRGFDKAKFDAEATQQ